MTVSTVLGDRLRKIEADIAKLAVRVQRLEERVDPKSGYSDRGRPCPVPGCNCPEQYHGAGGARTPEDCLFCGSAHVFGEGGK